MRLLLIILFLLPFICKSQQIDSTKTMYDKYGNLTTINYCTNKKVNNMKEVTIQPKKEGQHPLHFMAGGLHKSLGVKSGDKIPRAKMLAALSGSYGTKAKKQANFAKNVLTGGR